jgi:ATP-binding cassette subfamily B protein
MTVETFIYVLTLMEKIFGSFWRLTQILERISEAFEPIDRLYSLHQEIPTIQDAPGVVPVVFSAGKDIVFDDVTFGYNGTDEVLRGLSFTVEEGQFVGIVGRTGSGKSTITKLPSRLWDIRSGQIRIGGHDIKRIPLTQLRAMFATVPQDVFIENESIRKNISFGKPDATLEEVQKAARLAGIADYIQGTHGGYDTVVGERGVKLSGGQRQRIGIARIVLPEDRDFIVMDEATSALDTIKEEEVQTNLLELLAGKTAIVIAHRLSTVRRAHKIIVLDNGVKIDEGTHDQLYARGGLYQEMVDKQSRLAVEVA